MAELLVLPSGEFEVNARGDRTLILRHSGCGQDLLAPLSPSITAATLQGFDRLAAAHMERCPVASPAWRGSS